MRHLPRPELCSSRSFDWHFFRFSLAAGDSWLREQRIAKRLATSWRSHRLHCLLHLALVPSIAHCHRQFGGGSSTHEEYTYHGSVASDFRILSLARLPLVMKKILLCLTLLFAPILVLAGAFNSFTLSGDQTSLSITTSDGTEIAAPKYTDQVGFTAPQISADGKYVGWLALYPNCCTSYPIPLSLVVLDESQRLHSFDGDKLAVFAWCFLPRSAEVAFTQTTVHGSNFQHFEKHAIVDERLIAEYEYPHEDDENARARKRAPKWVHCVPELFPVAKADRGKK
jgi:hypothetical protein